MGKKLGIRVKRRGKKGSGEYEKPRVAVVCNIWYLNRSLIEAPNIVRYCGVADVQCWDQVKVLRREIKSNDVPTLSVLSVIHRMRQVKGYTDYLESLISWILDGVKNVKGSNPAACINDLVTGVQSSQQLGNLVNEINVEKWPWNIKSHLLR